MGILFLAFSCQKQSSPIQLEDSVLQLSTSLVSADYVGSEHSVNYILKGERKDIVLQARSEQDWIQNIQIEEGVLSFTLTKNESAQDRTGKIELFAEHCQSAIIHVLQSKYNTIEDVFHEFDLKVSDISSSSAVLEINPVDPSASYMCMTVPTQQYDSVGEEDFVKSIIAQMEQLASIYGISPSEFLYEGYFNSKENNAQVSLMDNTQYYLLAFKLAFNENNKPSSCGKVELVSFRTKPATQIGMDFTLSMSGKTLTVEPNASYTYICDVTTKEIWDEYSSPEALAREYISVMRSYGVLNNYIYKGKQSISFEEISSDNATQYVAYAVGYRDDPDDRGLTTAVKYIEFSIK